MGSAGNSFNYPVQHDLPLESGGSIYPISPFAVVVRLAWEAMPGFSYTTPVALTSATTTASKRRRTRYGS